MHDYLKLHISANPCSEDITDLLAAFLADEGYESFIADDEGLNAYIIKDQFDETKVKKVLSDFPIETNLTYSFETEKGKDWNEEWEKNYFKPILIGEKCVVHSSFHKDIPEAEFDIQIDPKMAFGTGHHSTTSGMIRLILEENLEGKSVIDMGTGTGILAFLCKMKGASEVVAIEIDPFAIENARENAVLNNLDITFICGDASSLKETGEADLFMANINRNIITNDLKKYSKHLKKDGTMMLSGFYSHDIPIVMSYAEKEGLTLIETIEDNNWVAIKLKMK